MLIPSYYPPVGGGAVQLRGLLEWLDRERFAPFVLTRRIGEDRGTDRVGTTPVVRISVPPRPSMIFYSTIRYLWKHRRKYDVIHVHSFDSLALAGALIKHLIPRKTLVLRIPRFGKGSPLDRLTRTRLGRTQLRFVLGKADAVIPSTTDATNVLKAWGLSEERIARIPNGVEADRFYPATEDEKRVLKRSFGIAENAFVGVLVARLIPRSNAALALKAWKRVCSSHPGSVLIVVGAGPEGPQLSAVAESELDVHSVVFTGDTTREEVSRLLRTADLYISYSRSAEISNVMLEAMSSGLPVVAAGNSSIDETVCHAKTGFLFDPNHPMDGADYMIRLAEDPELLRSLAAETRREVEAQYSFGKTARLVEQLYEKGPCAANDQLSIHVPTQSARPTHGISKAAAPDSPKADPSHHSTEVEEPEPQSSRKSRRSRRRRKKRVKVTN
jgi:glycosyltransferase involved in cell wall biosynthesis